MPFIVFEGLDGSGKSTLIRGLSQALNAEGKPFLVTREPGGTPLGDEIRRLLLEPGPTAPVPRAELLLYLASRAQHVDQVLKPALKRGDWVLCDRYSASTLAFQCGGRGLNEPEVVQLDNYATANFAADLTVLLDVTVATAEARRQSRVVVDRFEQEASEFHRRVREHYLAQAAAARNRWLVIAGDDCTPDQLVKRLLGELKTRGWL